MVVTQSSSRPHSLLLKMTVLFLFFLPLRSVELPSVVFGFSINPARLFISLAILFLFGNIALEPRYLNVIFGDSRTHRNPYVGLLVFYFLLSLFYYYILVVQGKTFLFSGSDFFTRNWQGRPIAQFLSLLTYAIFPFYLVKHFAREPQARSMMEHAWIVVTVVLLYYGYLQQLSYYIFGTAITPQNFDTGLVPVIFGARMAFLRFYSLAGEPRDFATFILGAIFFYWYVRSRHMRWFDYINIVLMVVALLLSFSVSSYLVVVLAVIALLADAILSGRVKIPLHAMRNIFFIVALVFISYRLQIASFFVGKNWNPMYYVRGFSAEHLLQPKEGNSLFGGQAYDLVSLYYILDLPRRPPSVWLLGYGYGNYLTATVGLLQQYFDYHPDVDTSFKDTRSYLFKLLTEGGIIGVSLYSLTLLSTLRLHGQLLRVVRARRDRDQYRALLLLRFVAIIFFVSSLIHISYYYFIVVGLIIGIANDMLGRQGEGGRSVVARQGV